MVATSENKIEELFKLEKLLITAFTQALVEQNLGLISLLLSVARQNAFKKLLSDFSMLPYATPGFVIMLLTCNTCPNL